MYGNICMTKMNTGRFSVFQATISHQAPQQMSFYLRLSEKFYLFNSFWKNVFLTFVTTHAERGIMLWVMRILSQNMAPVILPSLLNSSLWTTKNCQLVFVPDHWTWTSKQCLKLFFVWNSYKPSHNVNWWGFCATNPRRLPLPYLKSWLQTTV